MMLKVENCYQKLLPKIINQKLLMKINIIENHYGKLLSKIVIGKHYQKLLSQEEDKKKKQHLLQVGPIGKASGNETNQGVKKLQSHMESIHKSHTEWLIDLFKEEKPITNKWVYKNYGRNIWSSGKFEDQISSQWF